MTTWTVNGVPLLTLAQRIESGEELYVTPGLVGEDIPVADRDGGLDPFILGQRRRADGLGMWAPHLWLKGVDPDTGEIGPDGSEQDYLDNVDATIRLFHARPLVVVATRPNGSQRGFTGHLVPGETLDFTRQRSSPVFGQYRPAVAIPGAHWVDLDLVTVGPTTVASGDTIDLSAFAVATAPCTELIVDIGPSLNLYLTHTDGAGHLGWQGAIASGRTLRVNTATPAILQGAGSSWSPDYAQLDYSPGPRYFEIDPSGPCEVEVTFDGGGTVDVTISGYPRYRTA